MSKLLLIEPDKMLRHAFMMALYADFQLQFIASLPEAAPKDFDAVIVDAAALQGRDMRVVRNGICLSFGSTVFRQCRPRRAGAVFGSNGRWRRRRCAMRWSNV